MPSKSWLKYAKGLEGLYFSHKTGRFFEAIVDKKQSKDKTLAAMTLFIEDGEVKETIDLHVGLFRIEGIYELIIPYSEL